MEKTPKHGLVRQGAQKRRIRRKQLPQAFLAGDGRFRLRRSRRAGAAQGKPSGPKFQPVAGLTAQPQAEMNADGQDHQTVDQQG